MAVLMAALALMGVAMVALWVGQRSAPLTTSESRPRVVIGIPTQPSNAAWFVGLDQGLFEQEGIDVVHKPYALGLHALNAVRNGEADLAIAADTPFVFAVLEGAPIAIAVTTYNSRNNLAIIARRDRGIAKPEDLRGHTIGYVSKTNAHFFLDSFLLVHGLSPADVVTRNLTAQEIVPAFADGSIDALSAWEPLLTSASAAVGGNTAIYHAPEIYTFRFNLIGTRRYIDDHAAVMRAIIRGLRRANAVIEGNPGLARKITETAIGSPLSESIRADEYQAVLDQALLVALEDQARWALANGLVPDQSVPNFLRNLAPEALLSEAAADVTLVR